MIRVVALIALAWVTTAWSVEPRPQVKSAAELAWEAIPDTIPDAEQVRIAREYLDLYPNEIPLLRSVQNILNRKSDLTEEFWKARMTETPSSANRYLWARKNGETGVMKEQSAWIIEHDPENYWGYYLAAVSEMNKEKPDQAVVIRYLEAAIAKDPSRPEGWYFCADAYEQSGNLDRAIECYRAAMVVDPTDKTLEMSVIGIYARKRDAEAYFSSVSRLLQSEPPLALDLERYNSTERLTTNALRGNYTVLEVFAFWCNPCVKGALPEMNKRATEGTLPFPFYALHAEGKNEGGLALMDPMM
ncbi:MAG: tetratricopeptide repeat protein [bacterium]|nr:tetratricopeptide repeat protein [bacterium]